MRVPGRRLIPALAAASVLIAGCGGSGETPAGTAPITTSAEPAPAAPADATTFTDPGGAYRMSVPPSWESGSLSQPKSWFIGEPAGGFRDNVNIIIEDLPGDLSVQDYLTASLENAPRLIDGFTLESQAIVPMTSGDLGGRFVYRGTVGSSPQLRFMAISVVRDRTAVTVTLTALPDRFDAVAADAQRYMRSLEALAG